uniref:Proton-coupled zinc antiporter SLC30A5 n=1 Tax=Caenorhabditis japonica TaxID=281687 RepID=A0A8R1E535_CAEJA
MLAHDFVKKDDRAFTPTNSSRSASYFFILILSKILRCIGICFVEVLTKSVHVVNLLWACKVICASILVLLQNPFASGKVIKKPLFPMVAKLSFLNVIIEVLWFYGITLCGSLRSVLVFELSSTVLLSAVLSFFKGGNSSSPSKSRGFVLLIVGFVAFFLMDKDGTIEDPHHVANSHHSGLNHLFYHFINLFGMADHKGGLIILIVALILRTVHETSFRHLSVEVGGAKKLHALVMTGSAVILTPIAVLSWALSSAGPSIGWFELVALTCAIAIFVFVLDFYCEIICFKHVADPVTTSARWSSITMFSCAFALAYLWYGDQNRHALTGGVAITVICFIIGTISLTRSTQAKHRGGHFVGISNTGLPLFTYGEAFLQKTSKSVMIFIKETLNEILMNNDSRRIFWFLCVNIGFCGVEFLYGFWTNSLGLISDGFHMLFDCSALVMGLVASVMARWPPSRHFTFGFGRVEILSGFINALFLCVIALFILIEALERLFDPPNINTDRLLFVAVSGLLVNLFGMYSLGEHGHSHGGASHGHSHGGDGSHSHGHSHGNANMQGVFLHVLADTLGSVFVIISTLMIQWFGWVWVDPLCSLVLSLLIIGSVYPLLISSVSTLLQDIPDEDEFEYHVNDVLEIEHVDSYSNARMWQLNSNINVASLTVQVKEEGNAQMVRHRVANILKSAGATHTSVQVEKKPFAERIQQLCPGYKIGYMVKRGTLIRDNRNDGKPHSYH